MKIRAARSLSSTCAALCLLSLGAGAQIGFDNAVNYPLMQTRPDWAAVGDFDGSADPDVAVTTGGPQGANAPEWVEIFMNQGNGTLAAGQTIFMGNQVGVAAILAEDVDRDGDLDLVVSMKNTGTVRVLFNSGGTFAPGGTVAVGGFEPRHLASADVDGDGDVDFVASNRASNDLSVLVNDGSGTLSLQGTVSVGLEPRHIALEDLNGDCLPDLAIAAHDSRRVEILFNLGGGSFGGGGSYPVPGNNKPSGMCAVDFDGDGDMDLMTTTDNNNVGQFCPLTNLGDGTFTITVVPSGGTNPDAVMAADLDADGDHDFAAADESANKVSVLPNLGGGVFGAPQSFPVGAHPSSIAGTDLDGNGSIDLVLPNRDSNNFSVLTNAASGGTQTYCSTSANSVGGGGLMGSSGTLSIGANLFTLSARCCPPQQLGLFYYGGGAAHVPFGDGLRCVAGPFFRLGPPVQIDAGGSVSRLLDFTSSPADSGPGEILAGSTWYFQLWYRDPDGGFSGFNLTDGLRATFLP